MIHFPWFNTDKFIKTMFTCTIHITLSSTSYAGSITTRS
ncbi:unnamed protein product [Schistosoma curassoni]|uniref:Uncharacterized protein n=2 Tax=Schistosoma TaxID=6181 RepID=A0A183KWP3_9TREM|nr:unnamed protein product [Schistosoma margrebowiei]VDP69271.1 unnamed protein product [Schistosoma curassoni]